MPEILSIGELLDLGTAANMSAYIPYSGLEYNASGAISGISGSAIAGVIESSVVSSIVSSMVSGKADQSAVEGCCSAMSAAVSAKLDATASSLFQPSGEYAYESSLSSYLPSSASSNFAPSDDYAFASSLSSYIPYSSVAGEDSQITSINGSAIAGGGGGGIDSATCSAIASSYAESAVSGKADQSSLDNCCSAMSSVVSAKADSSALSSYAYNSAVSGKLDASASSQFYLASNPSGFLTSQVVTAVAGDYGFVTSINGSGLSGQGGGSTPSYTETQLIINSSNMTASTSTAGITIGVKVPVQIVSNSSQATGVNIVYIVTG